MIISLLVFYISILVNKEYYKKGVSLTKNDLLVMGVVFLTGSAIILIFIGNFYAFLIGSLIITFGNFAVLYMKYKRHEKKINMLN